MSVIQPPKPGTPTAPHIRRMMEEGDQLAQRLGALKNFVQTELFKELAPIDAHILSLQGEVMQAYLHILTIRLARANDADKGVIPDVSKTLTEINTGKLDVNWHAVF